MCREPGIPGADGGGPRDPGSQSREPMPAYSPRTRRDRPGRICRRRLPARLPQTGPDIRFVPEGQGGTGSTTKSAVLQQPFFAQAFFTFDFIPKTLPSLFGPVDRAGLAAWVRDHTAGTRRCRLLGRGVHGAGRGRSHSSAASAAAVTGSSIRSGSPSPGTGAPRVFGPGPARCLAVLVAQRPSAWPAAAFCAGCQVASGCRASGCRASGCRASGCRASGCRASGCRACRAARGPGHPRPARRGLRHRAENLKRAKPSMHPKASLFPTLGITRQPCGARRCFRQTHLLSN